jgi:hypothetical protein
MDNHPPNRSEISKQKQGFANLYRLSRWKDFDFVVHGLQEQVTIGVLRILNARLASRIVVGRHIDTSTTRK